MTVAPTLQKGLKRLFSSAVLEVIAAILVIVGLIAMIAGLAAAVADGLSGGTGTGGLAAAGIGGILTLVAGILVIIAAILSLIGIINTSKENNKFKTALYAVLIGLVLSIVSAIVGQSNPTISSSLNLLVSICNVVMFLGVCSGVNEVGEKLGRSDFLGKYNTIVILYGLSALLSFIGGLMALSTIGYVLRIVGSLCSLISFIMYMGYLRKAIHAVDGVPVADQYQ